MRREVSRIGVEVDDQVAGGHGKAPPQCIALAERRPELGPQPAGYGGEDLFEDWLITTSSMVFRNLQLAAYPRFMEIATHEDLALMVYLAARGDIGYIDRRMSVYRRHPGSTMRSFVGAEFATREIEFLREVDRWSDGRYRRAIGRRISGLMRSRALAWAGDGRRTQALAEMAAALKLSRSPWLRVLKESARFSAVLLGVVKHPASR